MRFTDLSQGGHVVALFQNLNGNGRLDMNLDTVKKNGGAVGMKASEAARTMLGHR